MEMYPKTVITKVQEWRNIWLSIFIPMGIIFPLCLYLDKILPTTFYGINFARIGIVVFLVLPICLIPLIKKINTKKLVTTFGEEYFSIEVFKVKSGVKIKGKKIRYDEIKWVKILSTSSTVSSITIKPIAARAFEYVLLDDRTDDEVHDYNSSELIYKSACYHNERLKGKKSPLKSAFYASQFGLVCISVVSAIATIAVISYLYYVPRSFLVLMPYLVILARIVSQRKQSLATYNKLK